MVHIEIDFGAVGSVQKGKGCHLGFSLQFQNTRTKEEQTWKVDNADGSEMATSDKPHRSENPKVVTVWEEKASLSKESLIKDTGPQEVKTQLEQRELLKIGRSREEWSAWRNNMLGALKTNVPSPGTCEERRKKVPSEIMQRHRSHNENTPPSDNY
jgi:hypothetical protein